MNLKIYPVILQLVKQLAPMLSVLRGRSSALGDQFERALCSIPLNVAEGAYSRGKNRQARYHSALGSAREALACLETAEALGWVAPLDPEIGRTFDHVIGTLVRLATRG
jgi:four helix bundle protein